MCYNKVQDVLLTMMMIQQEVEYEIIVTNVIKATCSDVEYSHKKPSYVNISQILTLFKTSIQETK